jgi:hypothetical protein
MAMSWSLAGSWWVVVELELVIGLGPGLRPALPVEFEWVRLVVWSTH